MRWGWSAAAIVLLAVAALAADKPENLAVLPVRKRGDRSRMQSLKSGFEKKRSRFCARIEVAEG